MNQTNREENAIVLDFLPNGYPFGSTNVHRRTPIVQALGKQYFVLLEVVPKKGVTIQPGEDIYIGDGKRDKIHHILGKLDYSKLTKTAETELKILIKEIVKKDQSRFVDFFNTARPLTTRMHQIELLPGFGKKHMWEIIEERKGDSFKSFEDIKSRLKLLPDPETAVIKRIIKELQGEEKHYMFVKG